VVIQVSGRRKLMTECKHTGPQTILSINTDKKGEHYAHYICTQCREVLIYQVTENPLTPEDGEIKNDGE